MDTTSILLIMIVVIGLFILYKSIRSMNKHEHEWREIISCCKLNKDKVDAIYLYCIGCHEIRIMDLKNNIKIYQMKSDEEMKEDV